MKKYKYKKSNMFVSGLAVKIRRDQDPIYAGGRGYSTLLLKKGDVIILEDYYPIDAIGYDDRAINRWSFHGCGIPKGEGRVMITESEIEHLSELSWYLYVEFVDV